MNPKKRFQKQEIFVNLSRLEKQGLIRKESDKHKKTYCLTDEGKEFVAYIKDRYEILNKHWDGKLRIVIFDIPESKRHFRGWLRRELGLLNFQKLQQSVYVGKHPLPESFYQEIVKSGLYNLVFVFTVDNFDKNKQVLKLLEL